MLEHGYDEWRAYRQSKLAQIMFSFECGRRLPGRRVRRAAPGDVHGHQDGPLARRAPASTVQEGADATVRLAADLDLDVPGRYFDGMREARPT